MANEEVRKGLENLGRRMIIVRLYTRKQAAINRAVINVVRKSYGMNDAELGIAVRTVCERSVAHPTDQEIELEALKYANER